MTLETAIANLERTIAGKRMLLDDMRLEPGCSAQDREHVRILVDELTLILNDLKSIEP
jgi:hypothetical protein